MEFHILYKKCNATSVIFVKKGSLFKTEQLIHKTVFNKRFKCNRCLLYHFSIMCGKLCDYKTFPITCNLFKISMLTFI